MARRPPASTQVLGQLARLSTAAPQVIAHRLGRMAVSGPSPSARDRKEFIGMVMEKPAAFAQGWQAMVQASMQANQRLWMGMATAWMNPGAGPFAAAQWLQRAQEDGMAALSKGLTPIERKASSNAKRLNSGVKRRR